MSDDKLNALIERCMVIPPRTDIMDGIGMEYNFKDNFTPEMMDRTLTFYPFFVKARPKCTFADYVFKVLAEIDKHNIDNYSGEFTFAWYLRIFNPDHFKQLVQKYDKVIK